MEFIFDLLLYFFEMLIAYMFISYNYEMIKKKSAVLLFGTVIFFSGAILLKFVNNDILNLTSFFIINLVFFKLFFDLNIREAIIYAIMLDVVMFSCELISLFSFSYILKIPTYIYKENYTTFVILTIISKILYFALSQLLAYLIARLRFKSNRSSRFFPLFIFPVLSIAFSFLFLRLSFVNYYQNSYKIAFVVLSLLMIISSLYIFYYYQALTKNDEKLHELQAEKRINEINDKYLEIVQHQNDEIHMLLHDTKNHYVDILNMSSVEEINKYIRGIFDNIERYDVIQITNNKLLDLLISKYSVLCKSNGIKLNVEVKTANLIYVPETDLSAIINNIMDNAIEAAKESEEKTIDFSIRHKNGFDILNVSNSSDKKPVQNNGKLLTTKSAKLMHGYGTKIIKKYAEKNDATYEWFYDSEKNRFNSTVIFTRK